MEKQVENDKKYIELNTGLLINALDNLATVLKLHASNLPEVQKARDLVELRTEVLMCSQKILKKHNALVLKKKLLEFEDRLKACALFFKLKEELAYERIKNLFRIQTNSGNPDIEDQIKRVVLQI